MTSLLTKILLPIPFKQQVEFEIQASLSHWKWGIFLVCIWCFFERVRKLLIDSI